MNSKPHLIKWDEIKDHRGSLCAIQFPDKIPFSVQRIFYIYDVNPGFDRGHHAHHQLEQFVICMNGSIAVYLESIDGQKYQFELSHPNQGVYIPPMTWTRIDRFENKAICLVLASQVYDEKDYIRDYRQFLSMGHQ